MPKISKLSRDYYQGCEDLLERDIRLLGFNVAPPRINQFLHLLVNVHSQLWNASALAKSLEVSVPTWERD